MGLARFCAIRVARSSTSVWALQDVSFDVHRRQALGIIGSNGAGKSTTFKLMTRTLKLTRRG